MITVNDIERASDVTELNELLIIAAHEHGCELDENSTYGEAVEWFENELEGCEELVEIIKAAEQRANNIV